MKQDCLDIGIIQAFMDGELDHGQTARVSAHVAMCDECASMLAVAEDESAVVFSALEREFNTLVPTQRLWNKINDSIAVERESRPVWQKLWAFLSVGLMSPSMAAAASLLVVVGVVATLVIYRGQVSPDVAYVPPTTTTERTASPVKTIDPTSDPGLVETSTPASVPSIKAVRAEYRTPVRRQSPDVETNAVSPAISTSNGYLPGEESYVKTIASLSRSVAGQKDETMRGSERISFERDLAVVDDAIAKMRVEVKKNPKNESAKQVLYSSYQNKIDLLNSVSQKEELVASLK